MSASEEFVENAFSATVVWFFVGCFVASMSWTAAQVCWFITSLIALVGLVVYVATDPTRDRL